MARKKERRERSQIHIDRNIIEVTLLKIQTFLKSHRKATLYALLSVVIVIIIGIGFMVYIDSMISDNQVRLETIMRTYRSTLPIDRVNACKKAEEDLLSFIDSTYIGTSHTIAYYDLGNIFYRDKKFKKAEKYLQEYADRSSNNIFSTLALLKAGAALEETGDFDGALKILKKIGKTADDNIIADQIYYNMARIFAHKKDMFNARRYFKKVISEFPRSLFALRAKKRLFMLGYSN